MLHPSPESELQSGVGAVAGGAKIAAPSGVKACGGGRFGSRAALPAAPPAAAAPASLRCSWRSRSMPPHTCTTISSPLLRCCQRRMLGACRRGSRSPCRCTVPTRCSPLPRRLQPEADAKELREGQALLRDAKQKVGWDGKLRAAGPLRRRAAGPAGRAGPARGEGRLARARPAGRRRAACAPAPPASRPLRAARSLAQRCMRRAATRCPPQVVAAGVKAEAVATDALVAAASSSADTGGRFFFFFGCGERLVGWVRRVLSCSGRAGSQGCPRPHPAVPCPAPPTSCVPQPPSAGRGVARRASPPRSRPPDGTSRNASPPSSGAGREIARHAEACGCESLVMGSRGLGLSKRALLATLGVGSGE